MPSIALEYRLQPSLLHGLETHYLRSTYCRTWYGISDTLSVLVVYSSEVLPAATDPRVALLRSFYPLATTVAPSYKVEKQRFFFPLLYMECSCRV